MAAADPSREAEAWSGFVGREVVVDTDSNFVYLGTLDRITEQFVFLTSVDAHDRTETPTTKERYVMDAKRFGIRANRKEVAVRKATIVVV